MLRNGPFWMLAGAVLVLGRFGWGRFGFSGPFSTFIGAVLAMGRFGRFPRSHSRRRTSECLFVTACSMDEYAEENRKEFNCTQWYI